MSSLTKIDDLPSEMICELFKNLQPNDLIACSMVNKRWHSLYSDFKIDRLAALKPNFRKSLFFTNWCYPDRKIKDQELCTPKMFRDLADKPLLSNLKHLALIGYPLDFEPKLLNKLSYLFSQLVHLEIKICYLMKEEVNLNFPKLKVLVLGYLNKGFCPLSIDSPDLKVLVYRGEPKEVNLLNIKHSDKIQKLDTDMFGASKLAPFKNVECLVTNEFKNISKETLQLFPRLNEIIYDNSIQFLMSKFNCKVGSLNKIKSKLRKFSNDAKLLRGQNFQLRFCGFQLNKINLDEIDYGLQVKENTNEEEVDNMWVYPKNYHLIEPDALSFIRTVNYTRFMNNVTGEFPDCFVKKFPRIERVFACVVQDEQHFLWYLNLLQSLRELVLVNIYLSQEFWNNLPASTPSLTELSMSEDHEEIMQLSFDFVGKFARLSELELTIKQNLSCESLASLVKHFVKLAGGYFSFEPGNEEFYVTKNRGSKVCKVLGYIGGSQRRFLKTENPTEILNFFETYSLRQGSK